MQDSPHMTQLLADQHHRDLRREATARQRAKNLRGEAASRPVRCGRKRTLTVRVLRAFRPAN
jgi:hypothetical protein